MSTSFINTGQKARHTDDMQDIITTVPSWILRWGITLFFVLLILIIGLSALIRYPDLIHASLTISSPNSPKPIVTKIQGKLVKLLVKDNTFVKAGQPLAYIESTASYTKVFALLTNLKFLHKQIDSGKPVRSSFFDKTANVQLGELEPSYQTFYQKYLAYCSTVEIGFYNQKRSYLQQELANLHQQAILLDNQKQIQQRDLAIAEQEFQVYQKLLQNRETTASELRSEESKYLGKKSVVVQTDILIITLNTNYKAKQNEILQLDNQIEQEKGKFLQTLNTVISCAEECISKYVLTASQSGQLSYSGIIQENQVLATNQEVFYIDPDDEQFFGEMMIPQESMSKVKAGQQVLIKLRSYPYEEYGMLKGTIRYISDIPYRDSVFLSRVDFKVTKISDMHKSIHLKPGMLADAEIITQNATILQRIRRNII